MLMVFSNMRAKLTFYICPVVKNYQAKELFSSPVSHIYVLLVGSKCCRLPELRQNLKIVLKYNDNFKGCIFKTI